MRFKLLDAKLRVTYIKTADSTSKKKLFGKQKLQIERKRKLNICKPQKPNDHQTLALSNLSSLLFEKF